MLLLPSWSEAVGLFIKFREGINFASSLNSQEYFCFTMSQSSYSREDWFFFFFTLVRMTLLPKDDAFWRWVYMDESLFPKMEALEPYTSAVRTSLPWRSLPLTLSSHWTSNYSEMNEVLLTQCWCIKWPLFHFKLSKVCRKNTFWP